MKLSSNLAISGGVLGVIGIVIGSPLLLLMAAAFLIGAAICDFKGK